MLFAFHPFKRYQNNLARTNPSLMSKIFWEFCIQNNIPDYMAKTIQDSILDGRQIDNMEIEEPLQTMRNLQIVRCPRIRDFMVLHHENSKNERKNNHFVNFTEDIFTKLVGPSSIKKIGRTNGILREANLKTPEKIRAHTSDRRNKYKLMLETHHIDGLQRTSRSPPGVVLGFSFNKSDLKQYLEDYVQKHRNFMQHVNSMTLLGDEGKPDFLFFNSFY